MFRILFTIALVTYLCVEARAQSYRPEVEVHGNDRKVRLVPGISSEIQVSMPAEGGRLIVVAQEVNGPLETSVENVSDARCEIVSERALGWDDALEITVEFKPEGDYAGCVLEFKTGDYYNVIEVDAIN